MASLAGCIIELPGADGPADKPAVITKKVVVTIEPDKMERDEDPRFEDYVKTRFEYRHEGSDAAADGVTAQFLDDKGTSVTLPLDRFTTQPTLRNGDVITISGANLTSGLVLRQGDQVLAQRGSFEADWFNIEGVPIPLTSTMPGTVDYKVDSEGKFEF